MDMEKSNGKCKGGNREKKKCLFQHDQYDKKLIKAINRTVILFAGYVMIDAAI